MSFQIIRNDITKVKADAIVNTANPKPTYAGAVDTSIFKAAGETDMLAARKEIGYIERGDIGVTPAFKLKAKYVIHTVGPVWKDGKSGEFDTLTSCYEKSLNKAIDLGCKSIAFPLISTGVYGFPKDKALQIAMNVLQSAAMKSKIKIYLVVYSGDAYELSGKIFDDIEAYIDENYVEEHDAEIEKALGYRGNDPYALRERKREIRERRRRAEEEETRKLDLCDQIEGSSSIPAGNFDGLDFDNIFAENDKTFQEKLFDYIDASGLKDSQIYRPIEVSRQTFSKIRSNVHYQPTKQTALCFCVQLKLDLEQTEDLLSRAGFSFSPSSKFDVIVKAAILNKLYDFAKINLVLIKHNCQTLIKFE